MPELFRIRLLMESGRDPRPTHIRGAAYYLIAKVAPELHDLPGPKPFSAHYIAGNSPEYVLNILGSPLAEPLATHLKMHVPDSIRLGNAERRILNILTEERDFLTEDKWSAPQNSIEISFRSPTFFRREGVNHPLPEPGLVFGSLLDNWHLWAHEEVPLDVHDRLVNFTEIRDFHLQTIVVPAHERRTAVIGQARYELRNSTAEERTWLGRLRAFAPFSGIGAQTVQGFGRVEIR